MRIARISRIEELKLHDHLPSPNLHVRCFTSVILTLAYEVRSKWLNQSLIHDLVIKEPKVKLPYCLEALWRLYWARAQESRLCYLAIWMGKQNIVNPSYVWSMMCWDNLDHDFKPSFKVCIASSKHTWLSLGSISTKPQWFITLIYYSEKTMENLLHFSRHVESFVEEYHVFLENKY